MPNITSAKKRVRQNRVERLSNRSRLSRMRTEVKEYRELVASEDFDEARKRLPQVYKVIDRTSQKGVIHANTAARYKSRLAHLLKKSAAAE